MCDRIPRADEAAEAVAEQEQRSRPRERADQHVKVTEIGIEPIDRAAAPAGAAVPTQIRCVHTEAATQEGCHQLRVAAAVLGAAVNEHDRCARLAVGRPCLPEQTDTVRGWQLTLTTHAPAPAPT